MKPILEIKNLSKKFRLEHESKPYLSLRESLVSLFTMKSPATEDFYALKDINFEVYPGESIGIIGKNGAGKSTLLKILSRITPPTTGKITARGRIASLLEVGTGFHPELSGRENIFLNGSILGMRRKEIRSKFDAIVDFSGVERFLDTPLKHYSSGMQLRLAFAVAAFLEPEILIIDEVLAVGDAEFQKKCIGKMEQISDSGRTLIFVSHDLSAITNITKRSLLLSKGNIVAEGETRKVIEEYTKGKDQADFYYKEVGTDFTIPTIKSVRLKTSLPNNIQINKEKFEVIIEIVTPISIPKQHTWLSLQITDSMERGMVHLHVNSHEFYLCKTPGVQILICVIPEFKLYMGKYYLNLYLSGPPGHEVYDRVLQVCPFEVVMYGHDREYPWGHNECTYIEDAIWNEQIKDNSLL